MTMMAVSWWYVIGHTVGHRPKVCTQQLLFTHWLTDTQACRAAFLAAEMLFWGLTLLMSIPATVLCGPSLYFWGQYYCVFNMHQLYQLFFMLTPQVQEVVAAAIQVHAQNVPVWDQRLVVAIFGKYYIALTMLHAWCASLYICDWPVPNFSVSWSSRNDGSNL